ncbi:hypothetical protein KHM83_11840 [Fusibacter paucivorans]|uniref:Prolyl-tRNA synthetase n=1 Tax=Fusibacter paucivorans TaxID=76009 RepID=A0ABS5PQN0_9FIRM|nr:YbaK/EbsC family protein [Fusibacter paucivorans]MBS7527373.1 hypothetical protein [Fusibacter paucivorans]
MKLSSIYYRSIKNPDTATADPVMQWLIQTGMIKHDRMMGTIVTPFGDLFVDAYGKQIELMLKGIAEMPCIITPYMKSETVEALFSDVFELFKFDYKSYKTLPAVLQMMPKKTTDAFAQKLCQLYLSEDANSSKITRETLERKLATLTSQRLYKSTYGSIQTAYIEDQASATPLIVCPNCGYGADLMLAAMPQQAIDETAVITEKKIQNEVEVYTPEIKTIDALCDYLKVESKTVLKAIALMRSDGKPVVVIIAGNRTLSLPKLSRLTKQKYRMATDLEIEEVFDAVAGFVGPIGLAASCQIIWDHSALGIKDGVCGANRRDYHYAHVTVDESRFNIEKYVDVAAYEEGNACPICGFDMTVTKGDILYELYDYGETLSESHRANFLDAYGKAKKHHIFGISIEVINGLKSVVRHHLDVEKTRKNDVENADDGEITNECITDANTRAQSNVITIDALAPFDVWLIIMNTKKSVQQQLADAIYQALIENGIAALYDDRSDSPGIKFFDAERFAEIPRIVVGKAAGDGFCDIQLRNERFEQMTIAEVIHWVKSRYKPLNP